MLHALQSLSQDVWNISSDFLRKQYLLFGLGIVSQLPFSLRYISHVSSHMVFNFAQGFWISNIYSHFKYLPTSVLYSTSLFSGGHNSWALIYLFCSGFGSTRQSLCIINIKSFHYYLLVKKKSFHYFLLGRIQVGGRNKVDHGSSCLIPNFNRCPSSFPSSVSSIPVSRHEISSSFLLSWTVAITCEQVAPCLVSFSSNYAKQSYWSSVQSTALD